MMCIGSTGYCSSPSVVGNAPLSNSPTSSRSSSVTSSLAVDWIHRRDCVRFFVSHKSTCRAMSLAMLRSLSDSWMSIRSRASGSRVNRTMSSKSVACFALPKGQVRPPGPSFAPTHRRGAGRRVQPAWQCRMPTHGQWHAIDHRDHHSALQAPFGEPPAHRLAPRHTG